MHEQRLDGTGTFKEILTLYFARVFLYCSLRPLMYGMTTPAPSINFPLIQLIFLYNRTYLLFQDKLSFSTENLIRSESNLALLGLYVLYANWVHAPNSEHA